MKRNRLLIQFSCEHRGITFDLFLVLYRQEVERNKQLKAEGLKPAFCLNINIALAFTAVVKLVSYGRSARALRFAENEMKYYVVFRHFITTKVLQRQD